MDYKNFIKQNWTIFLAIIYLASPIDFVPEFFLGPVGYIDDITLLLLILGQRWFISFINEKLGTTINKGEIKLKRKKNIEQKEN